MPGLSSRYNLNGQTSFDSDSEYANHPPPTDSEIEIEIDPTFSFRNRNNNVFINESLPGYVTDDTRPNRTNNRFPNNHNSIPNVRSRNNSTTNNHLQPNQESRNILYGLESTAMEDLYKQRNRLKKYGLNRLNVRQHIIVTICRDVPIYSILKNLIVILIQWYKLMKNPYENVVSVRATEFFLAALWCLVSALLSYMILDGFMVRWMVIYAIQAVIIRILSMSLIIVMIIEIVHYTFNNNENSFCLTVWILISCILTIIFIVQCFMSNNLLMQEKMKKLETLSVEMSRSRAESQDQSTNSTNSREVSGGSSTSTSTSTNIANCGVARKIDYYNLVVFAVVPIGVASFISTVGLIRLLLILRLDVSMEFSHLQQELHRNSV